MSVRFAPSPTGPFHVGNLRTAWISWMWAKALRSPWVVRFEDIDQPRSVPGAREKQLQDMSVMGLVPDSMYLQSQRSQRHFELFETARNQRVIYPCNCSRREVRDALDRMASAPHLAETIYDGHCRRQNAVEMRSLPSLAWRFRTEVESGTHDFIVGRTPNFQKLSQSDFLPSYHWACAIDDWDGLYQLLVRAWDLESATQLQRQVQEWLRKIENSNRGFPAVYHTALVTRTDGNRIEKRTRGYSLVELLDQGISAKDLPLLFSKTYSYDKSDFRPSRVWGEDHRELTPQFLGLNGLD